MTSDVSKYHIVPLWTGFYFSDTWGCQAAVHHSGNLRSLPWSLWPEFLRKCWKKKLLSQTCSFLCEENTIGFSYAEQGKQHQWRVLGWQLARVSVFPILGGSGCLGTLLGCRWLLTAAITLQLLCTRCRCSRLARYQSSFFSFAHLSYSSAVVNANCPLSIWKYIAACL